MKKLLLFLLLATPSFAQYRIPASLLGFHWIPLQITQPGGSSGSGLPAGCSAPDANTISCPTLGTSGSNGGIDFTEGTGAGLTAATSHCIWWGDSTTHTPKFNCNNGTTYIPVQATSSVTISGPTAARIYTGPDAAATLATGTGTNNLIPKYTTGASAILGNSSITDDGTTVTSTDTGGFVGKSYTANGTTAGFFDAVQGTDNGAPAVNTVRWQAPTGVTAYRGNYATAAATGIPHYANSANVITETISAIDLSTADATGTLAAARMPALTGDCTTSAGAVATTCTKINGIGIQRVTMVADWTCGTAGTSSSCTAATIVGTNGTPLTITLPSVAASYHWQCDGVVGQATAATANSWNVITATNAPTNLEATYQMNTAATAMTGGAITGVSATTTQVISPTWTLGGTATKMPFHIQGSIEGASASGTVVSLQLVAPTVADLVTVYRGATCSVTPF